MIDVIAINAISEWILRKHIGIKKKSKEPVGIDKIDIFNIFRLLTNKGIKQYFDIDFLNGKESEIQNLIEDGEIDHFIKEINPFFKKPYSTEKYSFYLKYYFISKLVVDNLNKLLQERQKPSYFMIYDDTNDVDICYEDCESKPLKKGIAKYQKFEQVKEAINYYASAYTELGLSLKIKLYSFNEINELLETEEINL